MINRALILGSAAVCVSLAGCSISQQAIPNAKPVAAATQQAASNSRHRAPVPRETGLLPLQISITDLNSGRPPSRFSFPGNTAPIEIVNASEVLIELESPKSTKRVSLDTGSVTTEMAQVSPGHWRVQFQYLNLHNSGDRRAALKINLVQPGGTSQVSLPVLIIHDE
ncbi:MAG: hypothetical protein ACR2KS_07275 [Candidatus Eremiobacter antarcticus]